MVTLCPIPSVPVWQNPVALGLGWLLFLSYLQLGLDSPHLDVLQRLWGCLLSPALCFSPVPRLPAMPLLGASATLSRRWD